MLFVESERDTELVHVQEIASDLDIDEVIRV